MAFTAVISLTAGEKKIHLWAPQCGPGFCQIGIGYRQLGHTMCSVQYCNKRAGSVAAGYHAHPIGPLVTSRGE